MGIAGQPIVGFSEEDQKLFWDEILAKEEGVILKFDFDSKKGKVQSLVDGQVYVIDDRALAQTSIELQAGDIVLIAPFLRSGWEGLRKGIAQRC